MITGAQFKTKTAVERVHVKTMNYLALKFPIRHSRNMHSHTYFRILLHNLKVP